MHGESPVSQPAPWGATPAAAYTAAGLAAGEEDGCGKPPATSDEAEEAPPPEPRPWQRPRLRPEDKDIVDEASEESFPASDPPAFTPTKVG